MSNTFTISLYGRFSSACRDTYVFVSFAIAMLRYSSSWSNCIGVGVAFPSATE